MVHAALKWVHVAAASVQPKLFRHPILGRVLAGAVRARAYGHKIPETSARGGYALDPRAPAAGVLFSVPAALASPGQCK